MSPDKLHVFIKLQGLEFSPYFTYPSEIILHRDTFSPFFLIMRPSFVRLSHRPSAELQQVRCVPVPTGVIEAGTAVHESLDEEAVMMRMHLVSISQSSRPYLGVNSMYNKQWYMDIVTLPHNSIRMLLSKLYSVVNAARQLSIDMTRADYEKFYAFASQVRRYIQVFLEAEEKILYPCVEKKFPTQIERFSETHMLSRVTRQAKKSNLLATLTRGIEYIHDRSSVDKQISAPAVTSSMFETTVTLEDDESRKAFSDCVQQMIDRFSSSLLEYFAMKESCIPNILKKSIRGARECNRAERRLIKFFKDLGDEFYFSAILAMPLQMLKVREDFMRRHFRASRRRNAFLDSVSQVEKTLLGTAEGFEKAAEEYQTRFSLEYVGYREYDGDEISTVPAVE